MLRSQLAAALVEAEIQIGVRSLAKLLLVDVVLLASLSVRSQHTDYSRFMLLVHGQLESAARAEMLRENDDSPNSFRTVGASELWWREWQGERREKQRMAPAEWVCR